MIYYRIQDIEIVVCDKNRKETDRFSLRDFERMLNNLPSHTDLSHFEVVGVNTQPILLGGGMGYSIGMDASISIGVKTTIAVKKVEE